MSRKPALPDVDRRQQILDAALEVFAAQGFEGAKTKEIAARAGVAQGLIYFYFQHKEELFLAAFEHHAAIALAQLDFSRELESDELPAEVLARIIGRFIDVLGAPHTVNLLRIMTRFEGRLPISTEHGGAGDTAVITRLARHLVEALETYLSRQIREGALPPFEVAVAVHFTVSGLISLMIQRALGSNEAARFSRASIVHTVAGMLLAPCARSSPT